MKLCRPLLGTFVEINCEDRGAIEAGFVAIDQVHRLMSAHEPGSEVSRVNRFAHREPVEVSPWTAEVMQRAIQWSRRSGGLFDPVRAGASALCNGALPLHSDQTRPEQASWESVSIVDDRVTSDQPCCIDLGGIAKGFAVDRAVEAMREAGATSGLVNAGGDMRGFGAAAWPATVVDPRMRHPLVTIELADMAIATSAGLPGGSGQLSFDHLPSGSRDWISVTVRAPNCCEADALTKIVWADPLRAEPLLREAQADAFVIDRDLRVQPLGQAGMAAA